MRKVQAAHDAEARSAMREPHPIDRVPELDSPELLRGLGKHEIEAIQNAAVKRTFRASEVVITAEEPALHFFLLKKGLVDYSVVTKDGREILLGRLIPGDPLGFAALLSRPIGYLCTATSVRESEALMWEHRTIHELGMTYPRLTENALRIGLHYIALYIKRHIALVSTTAQERVAGALTRLASRTGHVFSTGLEVEVKNEELASLADVNSYSVSRFLQRWDRKGALKKSRGKILLRRPEYLLSG